MLICCPAPKQPCACSRGEQETPAAAADTDGAVAWTATEAVGAAAAALAAAGRATAVKVAAGVGRATAEAKPRPKWALLTSPAATKGRPAAAPGQLQPQASCSSQGPGYKRLKVLLGRAEAYIEALQSE